MSRSDVPQAPPGGWPAQRGTPDQDPQYWAHAQPPAQARPVAPGHAPAPQRPASPPTDAYGYQAQGYYQQPAAQPAPQPQRPQAGYTPQFDPYAAQQQTPPGYAGGFAQPPQGYAPVDPRQADPRQAAAQVQRPDLRGAAYDQWPQATPQSDPRSYDLSSYMPPQSRTQPVQPQFANEQYANDYGQPVQNQQGYNDWGHQAGYAQQDVGHAASGYETGHSEGGALEAGYAEDDAGYEFEEPPRRRKGLMIAAALVGAIVVGGGLAYAYQSLLGPDASGPTPVIKSATGPSKVKPSDPGGKQFAHTDSKILGRLNDGSGSSDMDAGGAKKVPTLVVGRDGSIIPPSAPAEMAATASVPVPGMTLVDVTGPAAATQTAAAAAAAPAAAAAAAAAGAAPKTDTPPPVQQAKPVVVTPPAEPQKPVVIAKAEQAVPPTTTQSLADTPKTAATPAVAEKAPRKLAKLEATDEAAAAAAAPAKVKKAAAPVTAPTGAGYVAVLASVPASGSSRMDALKQFADMQQKYGTALQNKTPDVQEANLGDKGKYHRLVVGPPGSKDSANTVCSQLKTQGYASCWITAY